MKMKSYPKLRGYAAGGVVEEEPYGVRAARAVRSGLGQVIDAAAPVIEKANDYITAPPRALMKFGSDFANEYWGGGAARQEPPNLTAPSPAPNTVRPPLRVDITPKGPLSNAAAAATVPELAPAITRPTGLENSPLPGRSMVGADTAAVEQEAFNRGHQVAYGGQETGGNVNRQIIQGLTIPPLGGEQAAPARPAPQQQQATGQAYAAAPSAFRSAIDAAVKAFPSVDPNDLAAISHVESKWNPNAVSPDGGAHGGFQFRTSTAKRFGLSDPYDVNASALAAAQHLHEDMQRGLTREQAIAAYNQGPKNYGNAAGQAYLGKVLQVAGVQPQAAPVSGGAGGETQFTRPPLGSQVNPNSVEVIRGLNRSTANATTGVETANLPPGTPPELQTIANFAANGRPLSNAVAERHLAEQGANQREAARLASPPPELQVLNALRDPALRAVYKDTKGFDKSGRTTFDEGDAVAIYRDAKKAHFANPTMVTDPGPWEPFRDRVLGRTDTPPPGVQGQIWRSHDGKIRREFKDGQWGPPITVKGYADGGLVTPPLRPNPEDSLEFLNRMKATMTPDQVARMKAIDVQGVNADAAHAASMRKAPAIQRPALGYAYGGLVSEKDRDDVNAITQGVDLFDVAAGNANDMVNSNARLLAASRVKNAAAQAASRMDPLAGPFTQAKRQNRIINKGIAAGVPDDLLPTLPQIGFAKGGRVKIKGPQPGGSHARRGEVQLKDGDFIVPADAIRGPGTSKSDSVPARVNGRQKVGLSRGELRIPADVVKKIGPEVLEKMIEQARSSAVEEMRARRGQAGYYRP